MEKGKGIKPAKVFIYALAVAALGGGGYLAYDRLRRKKLNAQSNDRDSTIVNNSLPSTSTKVISAGSRTTNVKSNDGFPLKKGSSGARVLLLQQALAKLGIASISADGKFGQGTISVLKKAGYPTVIDEKIFKTLTASLPVTPTVVFNPSDIAIKLYKAAQSKKLGDVLVQLKRVKNVSNYSAVNEHYKKQGFIISKTIVTDLLNFIFKGNEDAKDQVRNEFVRIGLKEDYTGKWSLQGIPLFKDLITLRETFVIDTSKNRIPVRRNTILGDEVKVKNGMTWFRSVDNNMLCVPTQDVNYTSRARKN